MNQFSKKIEPLMKYSSYKKYKSFMKTHFCDKRISTFHEAKVLSKFLFSLYRLNNGLSFRMLFPTQLDRFIEKI